VTDVCVATGLTHRYRRSVALDDVSLSIPQGGLIGVLGPDGVGKSTLLALIAGAKRLQGGKLRVLGADMAHAVQRDQIASRVAFMPQGLGRNLYPDLTVRENIDFFGRLFGHGAAERDRRTALLLDATGLAPFPDRPARKLSGGMRQKLGLCCALIHDPDLLILDEPTTGVDPLSRRQFWDLIARMRAAQPGMTVLVATAYMEEAAGFDRLFAMNAGTLLAEGTPAELLARTGTNAIEDAFIALLPEGRSRRAATIPPRIAVPGAPAIEASGLTCRFGDFTAVDDVSFSIARGEIFGFLGSNGCGKTTTMKVLTGLIPAATGSALMFGRPVGTGDIETRRNVGYMSQSFSLWSELTVAQNLDLHARLFQIPPAYATARIAALTQRFGLREHMHVPAADLPLGLRQRLSLAVAVVHEPEVLILDEPTSGVDPLARDRFWELLGELSREQGVTVFVSTHFMTEAARCDRVALMHAGRVLAKGSPRELIEARGAASLEDAFIGYLTDAAGAAPPSVPLPPAAAPAAQADRFSSRRLLAYARREWLELMRDHIRLGFAILGTIFLMLVLGFGIDTDVDHLAFAVLDRDHTPESRAYIEELRGSAYFQEREPVADAAELDRRLADGELKLAIEIPPGFGRDLRRGRQVEVGVWIDGAMPFHAETTRGYITALHGVFMRDLALAATGDDLPVRGAVIETRFRYNQDFESALAMVPGTIALLLALTPAILMALAVVREKELGSITNLYVTPVRRIEFILGKQLPYIGIAMVDFAALTLIAVTVFGVPLKGSLLALAGGALIYVGATSAYGLLISCFASTQIAALFGTAIMTFMPAMQFSGMLTPVSSLTGSGLVMGRLFPMSYFLPICVGVFTKGLGFVELAPFMLSLALFVPALIGISALLLRKQER
jgi:ribosome-dependent ATPase